MFAEILCWDQYGGCWGKKGAWSAKVFLLLCAGFVLSYKKEHNGWRSVRLGPTNRTYIAAGLMCGTQYRFTLHAFNRLGDSPDSAVVEAKTNGSGTCCVCVQCVTRGCDTPVMSLVTAYNTPHTTCYSFDTSLMVTVTI